MKTCTARIYPKGSLLIGPRGQCSNGQNFRSLFNYCQDRKLWRWTAFDPTTGKVLNIIEYTDLWELRAIANSFIAKNAARCERGH